MRASDSGWPYVYDHPIPWTRTFTAQMLPDMLARMARAKPDAPFLEFLGRVFSYAEIAARVEEAAEGFRRLGVEKGVKAGLFLPNCPQYVIAYYAIMRAGGTAVNFSPLYSAEELAWQVEDSETDIMVCLDVAQLFPTIAQVQATSRLKALVVGTLSDVLPRWKGLAYTWLKKGERSKVGYGKTRLAFRDLYANGPIAAAPQSDPHKDIALLQYTGGTTGRPKGAILTHANLSINAAQVDALDGDREAEDRILGALPLFHVFANTCVLNRTVLRGGKVVLLPKFEIVAALKAISDRHITALPGVPTMYQAFLDHPDIEDYDLTSLRICISGGAPMPAELRAAFVERTGAKLVEGYGLTESSGVVSCNPYEGGGKRDSIGQPIPGTAIVVVDKEDSARPLAQGERGEITVAGPQIMRGYWNRPGANETAFVDGRLRTGDVGYIDQDGYVFVVDRLKDLILVGGFNVYPSALETVLYTHEAVKEAIVIGIPDTRLGERPKAFVTLAEGQRASETELLAFLNANVGKHERAAALEIRDALPKTMIGKLSRKELVAEERAAA